MPSTTEFSYVTAGPADKRDQEGCLVSGLLKKEVRNEGFARQHDVITKSHTEVTNMRGRNDKAQRGKGRKDECLSKEERSWY